MSAGGFDEGDDVVEVGGGSGGVEVVHALEVEGEPGGCPEGLGDPLGGAGVDVAAVINCRMTRLAWMPA